MKLIEFKPVASPGDNPTPLRVVVNVDTVKGVLKWANRTEIILDNRSVFVADDFQQVILEIGKWRR